MRHIKVVVFFHTSHEVYNFDCGIQLMSHLLITFMHTFRNNIIHSNQNGKKKKINMKIKAHYSSLHLIQIFFLFRQQITELSDGPEAMS